MTDKLTDNEIVKALEFCADSRDTDKHCLKCPYCNESYCLDKMMADALSLINRQKAEIERLTAEYTDLREQFRILDFECSRLERHTEMYYELRAEAIKEVFDKFDERLFVHSFKAKSDDYAQGQVDCMDFVDSKIEELKKELVGDSDA